MKNKSSVTVWLLAPSFLLFLLLSFSTIKPAFENDPKKETTETKQKDEDRFWITIETSNRDERIQLSEMGMDLVEINKEAVSGIGNADLLTWLENSRFVLKSKIPLEECLRKEVYKNGPVWADYNEVTTKLMDITQTNTDVASLFSIGKTIQGREIWALRLNNVEKGFEPSTRPGCVLMATIHAREHLVTNFALALAQDLVDNKNTSTVKEFIEALDIYIIPLINPDGVDYDLSGNPFRCYRKNMRINRDSTLGVDLNRNYDCLWGGPGSSGVTGSDIYRGRYAFSEPENKAIKNFIDRKNNITTLISYHTYGELILYPWGGKFDPIENEIDKQVHISIAQEMAKIVGYEVEQASEMYLSAGGTTDWSYAEHGIISYTFELYPASGFGCSGFYPTDQIAIDKAINDNIEAAKYLLSVTDNPYKVLPAVP